MTLPTGLLPAVVFVLTVGVSTLTTVGARLLARRRTFTFSLAASFGTVGALYLVGVGVVWWLTGGGALWGLAAGLVAAGAVAFVLLGVIPLFVGRRLVCRVRDVDPEPALRLATTGWPVAMLVVFGLFVAPGGLRSGHLLDLGGPRICLVGFCGISLPLLVTVACAGLVALLGPGLVGLAVYEAGARTND